LRFFCFGFGFGFFVDIFEQPNWTSQEFLEQKKKAEEEARLERERHEKERLLALKNKEKREQSAVASSEVKQRLQVRVTRLFFFSFLFRLNRRHNAPQKRVGVWKYVFRFISMQKQVNHLRAYTFSCVTQCLLHIDVTVLRLLYPCLYHRNIPRFKKRAHCVTKVDHGVS
jgi:hypothetical protein